MELRGTLLLGAINTYLEDLRLNFEANVITNLELASIASSIETLEESIERYLGDGGSSGFSQAFQR